MKYAITLASFRDIEGIERTLERISGVGFDAIEMYGEPDGLDARKLQELFSSHSMPVCGVTGMWGMAGSDGCKRKLLSADAGVRKEAEDYVRKCVQQCRLLGGSHLNVCLFADDSLSPFEKTHRVVAGQKKADAHKLAIPALSELSKFAADHGVTLVLEPLNRYSTPYCCSADDALSVAAKVGHENFRIMLDTFHMNIEEDSFEHTISRSKEMLAHIHLADNNRKMPGYGHIDFQAITGALTRAGYGKYATFEPTLQDDYDEPVKNGLQFVRGLERAAKM